MAMTPSLKSKYLPYAVMHEQSPTGYANKETEDKSYGQLFTFSTQTPVPQVKLSAAGAKKGALI